MLLVWKKLALLLLVALEARSFSVSQQRNRVGIRQWQSLLLMSSRSAASQERRDEEKRRKQRKSDVVIGKTSALRDASDLALNPKATEEEWMRQASREDQKVFSLTEEGMESLKMLDLEDASAAFDEVFKLRPNAYLWQAGIVKFYLDELESAANIFANSAAIYESKFGCRASEERIWRHACELKMAHLAKKNKKGRITREDLDQVRQQLQPIPEHEEDPDSLFAETRKVVRIAGDLFESSVDNDAGGEILSRAKLRSIGGNFDDLPRFDIKMWKLNAWYYLGLHYETLGEENESKECMKMAIRNAPNTAGNGDNIVHVLPLLHMSERDWFDDDDMDVDPLELLKPSNDNTPFHESAETAATEAKKSTNSKKVVDADPLFSDSVRKSIAKMTLPEIQRALQVRGASSIGYKTELQDRLFESLMNDSGLAP
ncbi:expressed unknown protein [Seminavis robusta]|uniref:SAP domain-containing protein n=1 Tax=Seminavis robusta TaxID=568900 RepID=A0A9N8H2F8_9STRA|nr:expressed unknown protein [Seminavis robusta]|eukprot:Sro35_g022440.1 n/a (430) ;mRNA; r:99612-101053